MQIVLQTADTTLFSDISPLGLLLPGTYNKKISTNT